MKKLFYDCEIANCIPSTYEENDPNYKYCDGWHDFKGMGIAVIGVYLDWVDKYLSFEIHELAEFAAIANSVDEIIGFNSINFDDNLLQANGINIKTTFDLLCQVRIAAGMPPHFVRGVTRGGYSLGAIATANLDYTKTGSGELAPKLWQDGKRQQVIDYCLNDVKLLVDLYRLDQLVDPTDGSIFKIHQT